MDPKEALALSDISAEIEDDVPIEYYEHNGQRYYRVTSIIKNTSSKTQYALKRWRENTPDHVEISEKAADRGTAFHYYTMQMLRPFGLNTSHLIPPEEGSYDKDEISWLLDMSRRWIEVVNPCGILICEWPLYHQRGIFGGTFDIMTSFDVDALWENVMLDFTHFDFIDDDALQTEDRWLVDLKTYKTIREDTHAQLGAYVLLCYANGLKPDRMGVFQANYDNDSWKFKELDIETGIRLFINHWIRFMKMIRGDS